MGLRHPGFVEGDRLGQVAPPVARVQQTIVAVVLGTWKENRQASPDRGLDRLDQLRHAQEAVERRGAEQGDDGILVPASRISRSRVAASSLNSPASFMSRSSGFSK